MAQTTDASIFGAPNLRRRSSIQPLFFQVEVQEAEEVETVEAEEAVQEDDDEDVEGMPEDEMPEDEEDVPFEEARDVDMGSGMIVNSIKKA